MEYVVVIENAKDGSFSAYVPDLPGCVSCGDTLEELRINIREAGLNCHIESLEPHGELCALTKLPSLYRDGYLIGPGQHLHHAIASSINKP